MTTTNNNTNTNSKFGASFKAVNLTQHDTTPEQRADGVADRLHPGLLSDLLTFDKLPSPEGIDARAEAIARHAVSVYERWEIPAGTRDYDASDWPQAMIGGAPFLMAALERALIRYRICPVYAFSVRESVEAPQSDGSVRKVAIFRHLGLVQPPLE